MILNRLEFLLMNNPIRAAMQRRVEARIFLRMGGPVRGGKALEIGCGRGVGAELILVPLREEQLWHTMLWFVAAKPVIAQGAESDGGRAARVGNPGATGTPPSAK